MTPSELAERGIRIKQIQWTKRAWGDYEALGYKIDVYRGPWPARLYIRGCLIGQSYRSIELAQAAAAADHIARVCAMLEVE
jgi:hypothetical protein